MFHKISLEGAMNWAIKGQKVIMVVPNEYAVKDISMRLNKMYLEDIPISSRPFLESNIYDDTFLNFTNGGCILPMDETNEDSFRGISCNIMYVHPWTKHFYETNEIIIACLEKGGIVF